VNAPLLTVTVAVVAAGAAAAGQAQLALAVLVCQAMLVAGWCSASALPAQHGGAVVGIGAGLLADALLLLSGLPVPGLPVSGLPVPGGEASLSPLLAVAAATFPAAVVAQLLRRDGHERLTASLAATVTVGVLAVLMSTLVAERGATQGRTVTVAVILAAGLAPAVLSLAATPAAAVSHERHVHAKRVGVPAALGVAAGVGLSAGLLVPELGAARGTLLCLAAGVLALVAHEVVRFAALTGPGESQELMAAGIGQPRGGAAGIGQPQGRAAGRAAQRAAQRAATKAARRQSDSALLLGATLPLALAAPAAYLLGRLFVG